MARDRIPFLGKESRDAQRAAQKRAEQNARVSRAQEAIKEAFVKRRQGNVTDEIYGGGAPLEDDEKKSEPK